MVAARTVQGERPGAGGNPCECDKRKPLREQRVASAVCEGLPGLREAGFGEAGFRDAGLGEAGFREAGFREAGFRDAGAPAGARAGAMRAPERRPQRRRAQRQRWRDGQYDRQSPSLSLERGRVITTISAAAQMATQLPPQQRRTAGVSELRTYLDAAPLTCVALGDQMGASLKHVRFDLLGASADGLGDLRMSEAAELG
jgi:hypothetical protein